MLDEKKRKGYHEQGERARARRRKKRRKIEKLETKADIQGQNEVDTTERSQRHADTHLSTRLPLNNLNVPLITISQEVKVKGQRELSHLNTISIRQRSWRYLPIQKPSHKLNDGQRLNKSSGGHICTSKQIRKYKMTVTNYYTRGDRRRIKASQAHVANFTVSLQSS